MDIDRIIEDLADVQSKTGYRLHVVTEMGLSELWTAWKKSKYQNLYHYPYDFDGDGSCPSVYIGPDNPGNTTFYVYAYNETEYEIELENDDLNCLD